MTFFQDEEMIPDRNLDVQKMKGVRSGKSGGKYRRHFCSPPFGSTED
jgi:hypothetical protein